MSEKQKPAKPQKRWTGKPGFEHWGEMKEPTVPPRPSLTMRMGAAFYNLLRGRL